MTIICFVVFQAPDHASVKENGGLTVSTRDNSFGESQGIDAVLVNTNQVTPARPPARFCLYLRDRLLGIWHKSVLIV